MQLHAGLIQDNHVCGSPHRGISEKKDGYRKSQPLVTGACQQLLLARLLQRCAAGNRPVVWLPVVAAALGWSHLTAEN